MNLKEKIKELCKIRGVSMNQVETDLNFGKGYISKLGQTTPNTTKIQQIAKYFNVSVDYLLGKEKSPAEAEREVKEDDIKLALFGGDRDITDEMWKEITQYAEFLKAKYYKKP